MSASNGLRPIVSLRIRSVIESAKQDHHKLTMADMESLQNDVTSLPALEFQKLLRYHPAQRRSCAARLSALGRKARRESSEAALYEVWFQQICRALGETLFERTRLNVTADLSPDTVLRILTNPDNDLFGDNPLASRDQMLADTLQSARKELEKFLGPDAAQWSWGKLHTVHFRHALDQQPGAKDLLDLGPLARPGDEYTVNATGAEGDSWEQVSGASYREILDTEQLGPIGRRKHARPERPTRQSTLLRPDAAVGRWPLFSATLFSEGGGRRNLGPAGPRTLRPTQA